MIDWSKRTSKADRDREAIDREARAQLAATDWYLMRQVETGEAVPADVQAKRAQARARLNPHKPQPPKK